MSNYGTIGEVTAFTRHLLDGQGGFNETTRPTATEIERMLVRASAALDVALAGAGIAVPVTQTTAKAMLDDWVVQRVVEYVELTQRGVGYSDGEGSRTAAFRNLSGGAQKFVGENSAGLKALGTTVATQRSAALAFTGMDAERDDPSDAGLTQPLFVRGQFGDPEAD